MRWPRQLTVEWIDVVVVVLALAILLLVTMEIWLPHT